MQHRSNWLFYFGEVHSFDPRNPQWDVLRKFWAEFLNRTKGSLRIAFVEGGVRKVGHGIDQAIRAHGGMGLLTCLANREGVRVLSPEPSQSHERKLMLKHFSREEIQYYFFARIVNQWLRRGDPEADFREYVERALACDERESGWKGFDFSLQAMEKLHHGYFKRGFDPRNVDFFRSVTSLSRDVTWVNRVARLSNKVRDEYIVEEIRKYLDLSSAFGNMGESHVLAQEASLSYILNTSEERRAPFAEPRQLRHAQRTIGDQSNKLLDF